MAGATIQVRGATDQTLNAQTPILLTDPSGALITTGGTGGAASQVQGNVAAGAADSGNPVKIGGVFNTTKPTYTSGQRTDLQATSAGMLGVTLFANNSSTAVDVIVATTDGTSGGTGVTTITRNTVFNGSTWDRQRGDTTGTYCVAAPSAGTDRSITATTTSQQLMAANTSRHGFFVKNDTLIVVWINLGATAVATAGGGNIAIAAGAYWESPASVTPSSAINIIAASTTAAVTAREF